MDDNNDFNAYDQAMKLVRDQTTALKACQSALKGCQAENEKLIQVAKFYAETPWKDLTLTDRGEKAREILTQTTGG